MARRRLDARAVGDAAAAIADAEGLDAVTVSRVAGELGIRPPSLYSHVTGNDGLLRAVALRGVHELAAALAAAAVGRAGDDALAAIATAYRRYASEHPGRYAATLRAPDPADPELVQGAEAAVTTLLAVLRGWDLDGEDAIHAARAVRSALHGFAALEAAGGFGLPADRDESYARLVATLAGGLRRA